MPKIIINSSIKSNTDEEVISNLKAILKDKKITYKNRSINVSINMEKNKVILIRENDEMKITLEFDNKKKTKSFYDIKTLGLRMNVTVKTKKLEITNNSLHINYDLYINNEFSDNFEYNLEWSDI